MSFKGSLWQESLGVQIAADHLYIAHLRASFRSIRLVRGASYELDPSQPLRQRLNAAGMLLADFRKEHGIGKTDIFVGVPSDIVMFREIEFPLAVRENLGATLRYEMEKYVPLPPDAIRFDHQVVAEKKGSGKMTLLLVVAKRADIDPYFDFCREIPGGVSGLGTAATACFNALAHANGAGPLGDGVADRIEQAADVKTLAEAATKLGLPDASFVSAFGLALRSLADAPVRINLLPAEWRRKPGRMGQYTLAALLACLLLAGLAWGGGHLMRQRMAEEARAAELQRLAEAVVEVDRLEKEIEALEARLDSLTALAGDKAPVLDILRELTQTIPETAWVQDFSYNENGGRIIGFADSATELIPLLEASPLFRDVVFLSTISKDRDGKERFSIGFQVDAYLDAEPR